MKFPQISHHRSHQSHHHLSQSSSKFSTQNISQASYGKETMQTPSFTMQATFSSCTEAETILIGISGLKSRVTWAQANPASRQLWYLSLKECSVRLWYCQPVLLSVSWSISVCISISISISVSVSIFSRYLHILADLEVQNWDVTVQRYAARMDESWPVSSRWLSTWLGWYATVARTSSHALLSAVPLWWAGLKYYLLCKHKHQPQYTSTQL